MTYNEILQCFRAVGPAAPFKPQGVVCRKTLSAHLKTTFPGAAPVCAAQAAHSACNRPFFSQHPLLHHHTTTMHANLIGGAWTDGVRTYQNTNPSRRRKSGLHAWWW